MRVAGGLPVRETVRKPFGIEGEVVMKDTQSAGEYCIPPLPIEYQQATPKVGSQKLTVILVNFFRGTIKVYVRRYNHPGPAFRATRPKALGPSVRSRLRLRRDRAEPGRSD